MAAQSDNKYDIYNWISSVIDSINNINQYPACKNLIKSFYTQHQDWDLREKLGDQCMHKFRELGSTKKESKRLLKG
jgi:hypothetical protein